MCTCIYGRHDEQNKCFQPVRIILSDDRRRISTKKEKKNNNKNKIKKKKEKKERVEREKEKNSKKKKKRKREKIKIKYRLYFFRLETGKNVPYGPRRKGD